MKVEEASQEMCEHLCEMERLFQPRCKLTLVMRDPERPEAYIVLTSEAEPDMAKVAALLASPQSDPKGVE